MAIFAKFPTPRTFNAPSEGAPRWNFVPVTVVGLRKTTMMPLPDRQKYDDIYVHSFKHSTGIGQTELGETISHIIRVRI